MDEAVDGGASDFGGLGNGIGRRFFVEKAAAACDSCAEVDAVMVVENGACAERNDSSFVEIAEFKAGFIRARRLAPAFCRNRFREETV